MFGPQTQMQPEVVSRWSSSGQRHPKTMKNPGFHPFYGFRYTKNQVFDGEHGGFRDFFSYPHGFGWLTGRDPCRGAGYEQQRFEALRQKVKRPLYGCDCHWGGKIGRSRGGFLKTERSIEKKIYEDILHVFFSKSFLELNSLTTVLISCCCFSFPLGFGTRYPVPANR